ncbi:hypothetical protein Syun_007815 [Stephania yunnanensis]|uniref:DRBM domain-containing protein n=1 Tax=Stephania yunnanensis TaxID=152371 RepID=A0AAP0L2Y2_9MAGN
MYKNQLQELAQRSCFNLPSYACIREGPDHAPRFKATVNFNGETFESPTFCTTLRQAEHAAAEVALNELAKRGPSRSLAARVLDETGVYKNLLQETAHRAGLSLPVYTTIRSGPGHVPVFTCTVELAGLSFNGEPAKTKKQAQKNAAIAAWAALKQLAPSRSSPSSSSSLLNSEHNDEQEQVIVARVLASLCPPETKKSAVQNERHFRRRKPAPIRRGMNQSSAAVSLYPMQYQSWPYHTFVPEAAMYHMWQQEQTSQRHTRLLPVAPSPPGPQILPFIRSIFRPDHSQYYIAREQDPISVVPITMPTSAPSLYFSNQTLPLVRSRSQVTIQEIQEERNQGEEKWIHREPDSNSLKANVQSNSSTFSPFHIQNSTVSGNTHSEAVIQNTPLRDEQKNSDKESKTGHSVQLDGTQSEQITSHGSFGARLRSQVTDPGPVEICTGSQHDFSQSKSMPHHQQRPHTGQVSKSYAGNPTAAPVRVRTAVPASSSSPRPESMNFRMPTPVAVRTISPTSSPRPGPLNFRGTTTLIAPAVQIRSVVPVCSAPSERKMPDSCEEGRISNDERKTSVPEDLPTASTELGKLRI